MMNKTKIEWVRNPDGTAGYTWNPITGCLNHVNGMCKGGNFPCYAYRLAHGRLRERYLANNRTTKEVYGIVSRQEFHRGLQDPFYPRFWPERLYDCWDVHNRQKPKGIFTCDMSDLFGIGIPERWTGDVLDTVRFSKQHRFYLLTKQPQNLIKFSPFPDNCWVGVTATGNKMADIAQRYMLKIEAKIKYLSIEPFLEHIQWEFILGYNQVIIGAQTKPYKPPKIEWVREIVEAADKAGIPVFLKDNLKPLLDTLDITGTSFGRLTSLDPQADKEGSRKREWYKLRQEMPGT